MSQVDFSAHILKISSSERKKLIEALRTLVLSQQQLDQYSNQL